MNADQVRESLREERTLPALNLYNSYLIGGIQLANYLEINSDYVQKLDAKYPGIKHALYEQVGSIYIN